MSQPDKVQCSRNWSSAQGWCWICSPHVISTKSHQQKEKVSAKYRHTHKFCNKSIWNQCPIHVFYFNFLDQLLEILDQAGWILLWMKTQQQQLMKIYKNRTQDQARMKFCCLSCQEVGVTVLIAIILFSYLHSIMKWLHMMCSLNWVSFKWAVQCSAASIAIGLSELLCPITLNYKVIKFDVLNCIIASQ